MDTDKKERSYFKVCPMCSTKWSSRETLINDSTLEVNGYFADFEKLEWSQFYFTHKVEGCFSTFVVEAKDFFSLYSGPKYTERRTGKDDCPGYCLQKEQLDRCDALCECAFNREIIRVIKNAQAANSPPVK